VASYITSEERNRGKLDDNSGCRFVGAVKLTKNLPEVSVNLSENHHEKQPVSEKAYLASIAKSVTQQIKWREGRLVLKGDSSPNNHQQTETPRGDEQGGGWMGVWDM